MIHSLVEAAVREAVAEPFNQTVDRARWPEGINWNFVDADCYATGLPKFFKDDEAYYEAFDDAVCDWVKENCSTDNAVQLEMDV